MKSLVELSAIWPALDEYHRGELRDFFQRWTHSWVNFSETMTKEEQKAKLSQLDQELSKRIMGLRRLFRAELENLKESPSSSDSQSLPELTKEIDAATSSLAPTAESVLAS